MTSSVVRAWTNQLSAVYIRGRRVRFLDAGDGPAIILLHGIPTHAFLWRDVVSSLQQEYRVIAPDLPGFGFSDRPGPEGLTSASMASVVRTMLELLGVGEYGLVGHDYGALVACELLRSQQSQITSLTITNTSLWRENWSGSSGLNPLRLLRFPVIGELALAAARPFMLKYAFSVYVSDRRRLTDEAMELYWYPFTSHFRQTLLQLYRLNALSEELFAGWRNAVRGYDGPAQVVWGMRDPTFTEHTGRAIAQILQHGSFTGLRHSNHFIPEDRPRSLSRLIAGIAG